MGTLYYIQPEIGDDVFALNKAYQYLDIEKLNPREDFVALPSRAEFITQWYDTDPLDRKWGERIYTRIENWAKGRHIRIVSEYELDDIQERRGARRESTPITGSAYDSDYEADGVTYIPGSAW